MSQRSTTTLTYPSPNHCLMYIYKKKSPVCLTTLLLLTTSFMPPSQGAGAPDEVPGSLEAADQNPPPSREGSAEAADQGRDPVPPLRREPVARVAKKKSQSRLTVLTSQQRHLAVRHANERSAIVEKDDPKNGHFTAFYIILILFVSSSISRLIALSDRNKLRYAAKEHERGL